MQAFQIEDEPLLILTDFTSRISYDDLPDTVVNQVKRILLDTLGCMFAGINTPMGQQSLKLVERFPDPHGVVVVGVDAAISPIMAAAANGALANVLDGDDGHRTAKGHPAGVVVPAALAAAEMQQISGRRLIEALVAGYEVGLRAGLAINSGDVYYGSGNWAAFGATTAASVIFGLTGNELLNALGICEVQTPICQLMGWIEDRRIPSIKEGMGWSAATGLVSALMAQAGVTGTLTLFKDKHAVAKIGSIGAHFEMLRLYFKRYSSCRWTHSALDHLFSIIAQHNLRSADIANIDVATFHRASLLDTVVPESIEQAQYSIPFLLAVAAIDGELGPAQMISEKFSDPSVSKLAGLVTLKVDPDLEAQYPERTLSRVTVNTKAGTAFSAFSETTRGDWNNPLSDTELQDKFRIFAGQVLSTQRVEQLIEKIWQLETLDRVGDLLSIKD